MPKAISLRERAAIDAHKGEVLDYTDDAVLVHRRDFQVTQQAYEIRARERHYLRELHCFFTEEYARDVFKQYKRGVITPLPVDEYLDSQT